MSLLITNETMLWRYPRASNTSLPKEATSAYKRQPEVGNFWSDGRINQKPGCPSRTSKTSRNQTQWKWLNLLRLVALVMSGRSNGGCLTPWEKWDAIIANVKGRVRRTTNKYCIELPTSVAHAEELDGKNTNHFWQNTIRKEMTNVRIAFKILESGSEPLRDGTKLRDIFSLTSRWYSNGIFGGSAMKIKSQTHVCPRLQV